MFAVAIFKEKAKHIQYASGEELIVISLQKAVWVIECN